MNNLKCQYSITLLKDRILQEYAMNENTIWMDDENKTIPANSNLILFGSFLENMIYILTNNIKYKQIYVLCSGAKKILINLLAINPKQINIVDRYRLFPRYNPTMSPSINFKNTNFFFAGRLNSSKNIDYLLLFFFFFQKQYPQAQLHIYGIFDNDSDLFYKNKKKYQQYIQNILKNKKWKIPPTFYGFTPHQEWLRHMCNCENAIYIDFSTYMSDDFNTAIALADQHHIPIITTNVGGRAHLNGTKIIIPFEFFLSKDESSIEHNAKYIANTLNTQKFDQVLTKIAHDPKSHIIAPIYFENILHDMGKAFTHIKLRKFKFYYMRLFSDKYATYHNFIITIYSNKKLNSPKDSILLPEYEINFLKYIAEAIDIIYFDNYIKKSNLLFLEILSLKHKITLQNINN